MLHESRAARAQHEERHIVASGEAGCLWIGGCGGAPHAPGTAALWFADCQRLVARGGRGAEHRAVAGVSGIACTFLESYPQGRARPYYGWWQSGLSLAWRMWWCAIHAARMVACGLPTTKDWLRGENRWRRHGALRGALTKMGSAAQRKREGRSLPPVIRHKLRPRSPGMWKKIKGWRTINGRKVPGMFPRCSIMDGIMAPALYAPCDRVAMVGHGAWKTAHAYWWWTPDKSITHYLDLFIAA